MPVDDVWHVRRPQSGATKCREHNLYPSAKHGEGKRWAARYRDDAGVQRSPRFTREREARDFLTPIEADLARGVYVDPAAGKVKLSVYADDWQKAQTTDASTREAVELRIRLHIKPQLGTYELRRIKPSTVQSWVKGLSAKMADNTASVIFSTLSAILQAAVDDGLLGQNPCRAGSVRRPTPIREKIVPWSRAWVEGMRHALPSRYRLTVSVAEGLGMRQGEIFGFATEDIDHDAHMVRVRRQVKIVGGRLIFAPPKRKKERDVPLAGALSRRIDQHMADFPPEKITLPWRTVDGPLVTVELIFVTREHTAINRNYFNAKIWKPALRACSIPAVRKNGMHALRHFFASMLLHAGVSIREVAEWLGHNDPGFTLRTYTHLMPQGEDRMRRAVDQALKEVPADGPSDGSAPDVR